MLWMQISSVENQVHWTTGQIQWHHAIGLFTATLPAQQVPHLTYQLMHITNFTTLS
jgi:hypothetical protein